MEKNNCPICHLENIAKHFSSDGKDVITIKCPRCGNFQLSRTLGAIVDRNIEQYGPRWLISAVIRNRYEQGDNSLLLTNTVELLIKLARVPSDPFESINLLLEHIHRKTKIPGEAVHLDINNDFPIVYARDQREFKYYIDKARELGLIEWKGNETDYLLGLKGWERVLELGKSIIKSNQAFVAMWFDASLLDAYREGIIPALEQSRFKPHRIDFQEHNDKIDDRIIAEIRRSGLLVADFTGHRGGVYFEAGFAMGLGIPVIWTCRKNHAKKLHFDTRQYNHIIWDTPEDLKIKLTNRIAATLPQLDR